MARCYCALSIWILRVVDARGLNMNCGGAGCAIKRGIL